MDWVKIIFNFGFPAVLCIYLLERYRKTIDKLNNTIANDLVHVVKKDSENTEKVEKAIDKLTNQIANMSVKK